MIGVVGWSAQARLRADSGRVAEPNTPPTLLPIDRARFQHERCSPSRWSRVAGAASLRGVVAPATLCLLAALAVDADEFPPIHSSESEKDLRPMPAEEAAAKMRVPEGFRVSLFAAEPEVQTPIAMAWDAKGRLWVAENYTYRIARNT